MVYTNKDGYGIPRKGNLRWTIDKPKKVMPVIVSNRLIEGVLHYVDKDGFEYVASVFERMWGKLKINENSQNYVRSDISCKSRTNKV